MRRRRALALARAALVVLPQPADVGVALAQSRTGDRTHAVLQLPRALEGAVAALAGAAGEATGDEPVVRLYTGKR